MTSRVSVSSVGTWVVIASVALLVGACRHEGTSELSNGQPSASALATRVLEALATRNEPTLRAIALDEQEFRGVVWPSLPAARPERNLPFSYVWGDLKQKSDASLARTLALHGGARYELAEVSFAESASEYAGYTVHRTATLRARASDGTVHELRVCGSFIEARGRWKVFSYVVDD